LSEFSLKLKFLQDIFGEGQIQQSNKELLVYCCFCSHHKKKLSINYEHDMFKCWVCNKSGYLYYLIKVKDPSKINEYVKSFKAKNITIKSDQFKDFITSLPTEYVPLYSLKDSTLYTKPLSYLKRRGINEEEIIRYKLGYCIEGEFAERIVIPSFNKKGNLNFFTARLISNTLTGLPYINIKNSPKGYRNSIIFNELNLDFKKPMVLVEGVFDMFKSVENTAPLLGSELAIDSALFREIISNKTTIIMALDPDAIKKALNLSHRLMSYDVKIYFVDASPFKDMGEMTKEEAKLRIENAKEIDENFILKNRMKLT